MEKQHNCPLCKDTGFDKPEHICICITGNGPKIPSAFYDVFGDIFGNNIFSPKDLEGK